MQKLDGKNYKAVSYIRLSKEDGDKIESNSISNQRDFIQAFVKSRPEIELCSEKIDDGYSGVSFERPAFVEMITEIKAGLINCVIVKDLSRFGRNYIEAGRYIEQIFPFLGVRFIAITDNYDSVMNKNENYDVLLPFKNLINDSYSRDISIKVRSQLSIRQIRGDYIGSFPVYGYIKSQEDRHKLVPDGYASSVVKDIFKWKLAGLSNQKIADRLNDTGVLSPLEYKKFQGFTYSTTFKVNAKAKWSATAIIRILKNEIYTGVMVQGKEATTSYKVKKRVHRPENEWIKVEGTHEAIISQEDFALVNKLLLLDTRVAPLNDKLYLFSGFLKCEGCGRTMIRRKITSGRKNYVYYICPTNKGKVSACAECRIREDALTLSTLKMIQNQVSLIGDLSELLTYIESLPLQQEEIQKIERRIAAKREERIRYEKHRLSLYTDYNDGMFTKAEYLSMKAQYEAVCGEIERSLIRLEDDLLVLTSAVHRHSTFTDTFMKACNITELSRPALCVLIEKIVITNKNNVKIYFNYQNGFSSLLNLQENMASTQNEGDNSLIPSFIKSTVEET